MKRNKKGQFIKGFKPWNKGTKGVMKANKTSFKKGDNKVPLKDRFWEKVDKFNLGGCWLWTAFKNNKGYGVINIRSHGGVKLAHRVAYELINGPIARELKVLHKCDNPLCVNPEHLFVGTQRDNMVDMSKKQRWGNQFYKNK